MTTDVLRSLRYVVFAFEGAIDRVFDVSRELQYLNVRVRRRPTFIAVCVLPPLDFAPWVVIYICGRSLLNDIQSSGSMCYALSLNGTPTLTWELLSARISLLMHISAILFQRYVNVLASSSVSFSLATPPPCVKHL
jgi:hypothetical protein